VNYPLSISIGPELPEFGSWNWLGLWMIDALKGMFDVSTFQDKQNPPEADILIFLKFKPSAFRLAELRRTSKLVFFPVDIYACAAEIDADIESLRCLNLVVLHCQRLVRYFHGLINYAYLDHPLKYVLPEIRSERVEGPLLWVGKKCNLAAATPCLKKLSTKHEIRVLTDIDQDSCPAAELQLERSRVEIGKWSPERHVAWMATAKAAIDVKGNDFRSRHKPPAKTLDFLASGVPVITNRGSSVELNLRPHGFSLLYEGDEITEISAEHQLRVSQQAMTARQNFSPVACSAILVQLIRQLVDRTSPGVLTTCRSAAQ
jgi:hypothetical protein